MPSLRALQKDKSNGVVKVRVLFDETHGITLNNRTWIRYQERAPKRTMRERSKHDGKTDVSEAHREVPTAEQDRHFLGCHVQPGANVFVNPVGTFVGPLLCCWSRVGSTFGRLFLYGARSSVISWHMLIADDLRLDCWFLSAVRLFPYGARSSVISWHMLIADDLRLEAGDWDSHCWFLSAVSDARRSTKTAGRRWGEEGLEDTATSSLKLSSRRGVRSGSFGGVERWRRLSGYIR